MCALHDSQVEVTADFSKQELSVKQLGCNHANVGGKVLSKNESQLLGAMGTLELVEGSYKYHVHFGKRVPKDILLKLQEDIENTSDEEIVLGKGSIDGKGSSPVEPTSGLAVYTPEAAVSLTVSKKKECLEQVSFFSCTDQAGSAGEAVHHDGDTLSDGRLSRKREHECDAKDLSTSKRAKIYNKMEEPSISTMNHSSDDAIRVETVSASLPEAKQRSLDKFLLKGKSTTLETSSPGGSLCQEWLEVESVLVLRHGSQVHSRKVAGFDLDGTLIETASGRR